MLDTTTAPLALTLGAPFSDNLMLQRGVALPIWGTAAPGETIRVSFAGQNPATQAGTDGAWCVELAPLTAAATPAELIVLGATASVVISNVLVGDVWLCAGQSNMEWKLAASANAEPEIREARYPAVRLLSVPRVPSHVPLTEMYGAHWQVCAPQSAAAFSAVAYFFGRELHRQLDVPIGLIDASWGGTKAEVWTSAERLRKIPSMAGALASHDAQLAAALSHPRQGLYAVPPECTADIRNGGYPLGWADLPKPPGTWSEMALPAQWQRRELDFNGVLWFRKEVHLPPAWAGRELKLSVGAVDKADTTYFNNVKVGGFGMAQRPDAYRVNRDYVVAATLPREGANVIAVRVHSDVFDGGMTGPAEAMTLSCPGLPEAPAIQLAGNWEYAVECNYGPRRCTTAALFNGMISPLTRLALRGVVWYQGESNEFLPTLYQELLPALIQDWRTHWGRTELPFLIVQLPNFRTRSAFQEDSSWALLREAQSRALRLPHTGVITTIDLGEANDVHPRNKQDVGYRVAQNALATVYGKTRPWSGPVLASATVEAGAIRLQFRQTGGGLVAHGDAPLKGFVLCGADRQFVPASAVIAGDDILVAAAGVTAPLAVRYAWADNPDGNLFSQAGLPAAPFRTDSFDDFAAHIQVNGNLDNARLAFTLKQRGTVAFLGGSITEMDGYRPMVADVLQKRFPQTAFTFINAGIGSTTSTTGAFRLEQDVLAQGPIDLLFLEFAVNDDQDGDHTREECIRGMEGIIRHARRCNPHLDIVVTFFVNEGMLATLQQGQQPLRLAAHQEVVNHYELPTIQLAAEVAREIAAGELSWEQYGGVHPAPFGNAICARMIGELFARVWADPLPLGARQVNHPTPTPLAPLNYEHGRFIDLQAAKVVRGWTLGVPAWDSLPGAKRPRFLSLPLLTATTPGAELTLAFAGTAVGAYILAGPDAGRVAASIDGGPFTTIELFHSYSRGLHYPRTVMLGTNLTPGPHTLTLRMTPESSHAGHAMRIIAFTAN